MRKITILAAFAATAAAITLAGCGTAGNITGSTAPAAVSTPSTQVTDPDGGVCAASAETGGYCPGDSPSPAASTEASLTVGQSENVEDNNNASDTASVTITSATNTTQSYDGLESPEYGYFVIFNISVMSNFNGFNIDSLDFYVTINGQQYDEGNGNSIFATENDEDITGTVNAGNTVTGQLYFDLPSIHGELVYSPNYDGAPLAEWSF